MRRRCSSGRAGVPGGHGDLGRANTDYRLVGGDEDDRQVGQRRRTPSARCRQPRAAAGAVSICSEIQIVERNVADRGRFTGSPNSLRDTMRGGNGDRRSTTDRLPDPRGDEPGEGRKGLHEVRPDGRIRTLIEFTGENGTERWRVALVSGPCTWCGGPAGTIDHVIPVSRGGSAGPPRDWVGACGRCNAGREATGILHHLMGVGDPAGEALTRTLNAERTAFVVDVGPRIRAALADCRTNAAGREDQDGSTPRSTPRHYAGAFACTEAIVSPAEHRHEAAPEPVVSQFDSARTRSG